MTTTNGDLSALHQGHMRQRSRYACLPCRHRKRKCDGKIPCSTCFGYGYECSYDTGGVASAGGVIKAQPAAMKKRRASPGVHDINSSSTRKRKSALGSHASTDEITPSHNEHHNGSSSSLSSSPRSQTTSSPRSRTRSSPVKRNGLMVPSKCRYIGQHSSVAFPQWVGQRLQSGCPPRLHSFAYNAGIRREHPFSVSFHIQTYISSAEVLDALNIYASVIDPVFGFVNLKLLRSQAHDHWSGKDQGSYFEALISGVIGVASLFSGVLSEDRELRVMQHVKDILDDPHTARSPRLETIQAWILQVIYIRSTSRPGTAWLYSCVMMHLFEATGIHKGPDPCDAQAEDRYTIPELRDICARVLMVARCLHVLISYEHGRSVVNVGPVLEHDIIPRGGSEDLTLQLHALISTIPSEENSNNKNNNNNTNGSQDLPTRRNVLTSSLTALMSIPTNHQFFDLIKADLAFCIYRRLRLLDLGIKQTYLKEIIQAGKKALPSSRILSLRNHPWWNIVGTVFQFVCVLLAIDCSESLATIPETMETLASVARHLKTHLADEALATARLLVRSMSEKKRREMAVLDQTTTMPEHPAAGLTGLNLDEASRHTAPGDHQGDMARDGAVFDPASTGSNTTVASAQEVSESIGGYRDLNNEILDFMDPLWDWDSFFESSFLNM